MESIEAIKLRRDRVEHLMDLLPRKGPKAFDGFIKALEESKLYDHLASLLTSSKSSKDKKARDRGVSCKSMVDTCFERPTGKEMVEPPISNCAELLYLSHLHWNRNSLLF